MKSPATFKFETLRNLDTVRLTIQVGRDRQPLVIGEISRKEFNSAVALADIRVGETLLVTGQLTTR